MKNRYKIKIRSVRKLVFIFLSFSAGCIIQSCFNQDTTAPKKLDIPVIVATYRPFVWGIEEVGILKATKSIVLSSPFYDQKISKLVSEGEIVKKGDPVVWFDCENLLDEYKQEEMKLKDIQNDLDKWIEELKAENYRSQLMIKEAKANRDFCHMEVELAERELENMRKRWEKNLVPEESVKEAEKILLNKKIELTSAEFALQKAEKTFEYSSKNLNLEIEKAKKRYTLAKFNLDRMQEDLNKCILIAPGDGVVIYARRGWRREKIKEGDKPWKGRPIVEIPDLSEMEVYSQIPEEEYRSVSLGQEVLVFINALDNLKITGKIKRIGDLAISRSESEGAFIVSDDQMVDSKVFEIVVELEKMDKRMRPGMAVSLTIIKEKIDRAILVPLNSVFTQNGKKIVYVKKGTDFKPVEVLTGPSNDREIVIKSGLNEGEMVAIEMPQQISKDKDRL